jgi:hypothetical protein
MPPAPGDGLPNSGVVVNSMKYNRVKIMSVEHRSYVAAEEMPQARRRHFDWECGEKIAFYLIREIRCPGRIALSFAQEKQMKFEAGQAGDFIVLSRQLLRRAAANYRNLIGPAVSIHPNTFV